VKYAYYPGCSVDASAREYGSSTEAVCQTLGVELDEVPGWLCCGASSAHMTSHELTAALPAATLARVAEMGMEQVVTGCPACYVHLRGGDQRMRDDPAFCAEVNSLLPKPLTKGIQSYHLLQVITADMVREKVKRPLARRKAAVYYGCVLTRPKQYSVDPNYEYPRVMDDIVEACGLEPVKWPYKTRCCGASLALTKPNSALQCSYQILDMAFRAKAEMIVVACPLCQLNLDMYQKDIEKRYNRRFNLPIVYFTQVVGLALGCDTESVGLGAHFVDPRAKLLARATP
jgi:heterodisulfide reductase subunit B2